MPDKPLSDGFVYKFDTKFNYARPTLSFLALARKNVADLQVAQYSYHQTHQTACGDIYGQSGHLQNKIWRDATEKAGQKHNANCCTNVHRYVPAVM